MYSSSYLLLIRGVSVDCCLSTFVSQPSPLDYLSFASEDFSGTTILKGLDADEGGE